jgi:hypothetical protein
LGCHGGTREDQDCSNGPEQLLLVKATRQPRAEQRAGDRRSSTDREQRPVDATAQMAEDAGDSEAEADGHVRTDGAKSVRPDEAKQRADAKGAENQADEAAEEPDHQPADDCRGRALGTGALSRAEPARPEQVDPEDDERDADRKQERTSGDGSRQA